MRAIVLLALILWPPRFGAGPRDGWFGVDKVKHFIVSALAQAITYSGLQYAGVRHDAALSGSLAAGAGLGLAREFHDRRVNGLFSARDLVWDGAGLATATVFLNHARR